MQWLKNSYFESNDTSNDPLVQNVMGGFHQLVFSHTRQFRQKYDILRNVPEEKWDIAHTPVRHQTIWLYIVAKSFSI